MTEYSDDDILNAFPPSPASLRPRELARTLGIPQDERAELRARLRELAVRGKLDRLQSNRYGRPVSKGGVSGTLTLTARGFGFVNADKPGIEDLYIDGRDLGDAMHRDRVIAEVDRSSSRMRGVIVEVLERGTKTFVGTYRSAQRFRQIHPQDPRLPDHVLVDAGAVGAAKDGDLVAARFTAWPSGREPARAAVIKVLALDGEAAALTETIVYDLGLPVDFSDEVEAIASSFSAADIEAQLAHRVDLRKLPLCTIDPESARDFDDAIYAEALPTGGWQLTVAIADVAHYCVDGSALDAEARSRGTSIYLPDRVMPMLPHALSSTLCSLRPDEDRLALVASFKVDPDGSLGRATICEAVIRSHARFTYDRAARLLGIRFVGDSPQVDDSEKHEGRRGDLTALLDATRAMRGRRRRRGYLNLDIGDPKPVFDEDGKVADVRPAQRHEAHLMVEDAMLAANESIAEIFIESELPSLFRVHDEPPEHGLTRYRRQALALGVELRPGKVTPKRMTRYLKRLRKHPDHRLLSMLLLRSMSKAVYSAEPGLHFGLGTEGYLHFTSPIRRYPDLMVHRLLKGMLHDEAGPSMDELADLAAHCSRRERVAVDAERAVMDLYKALYLQERIGEQYDGQVIAVTGIGLFVQLEEHAVEGLLRVDELRDDYYTFDHERGQLVGRRGSVWSLGDRLRIEVLSVSPARRRVNFGLVERKPSPNAAPKARREG